jgi:hypothetical protein
LVRTSCHRAILIGLIAALGLASAACEPQEERKVEGEYLVSELRFAGVDLIYALRRVAGEAGVLLVLDEIRPQDASLQDLGFERIDVDLEAGPIQQQLETLREQVQGAFDYKLVDDLLVVRSIKSLKAETALDRATVPKGTLEANFKELVHWIYASAPGSLLRMGARIGQPVYKKVTLKIPPNTSVMELFLMYAKEVGSGLRIRRAGYMYKDGQNDKVVANTVGLWQKLDKPLPLLRSRQGRSAIWTLAAVEGRTGVPLAVIDRSVMNDNRGTLNFSTRIDPKTPAEDSVDVLSGATEDTPGSYQWVNEDGLIKIKTHIYLYYLPGRDLLEEKVNGGTFEGTLAELTRWLNANRKNPSPKFLMGGEIVPEKKSAKIEVADGSSIEEVLNQFARAAGAGWVVNIKDSVTPLQPLTDTWAGAWVTSLDEWGPAGDLPWQ